MNETQTDKLNEKSAFCSDRTQSLIDRFAGYRAEELPVISVLCSSGRLSEKMAAYERAHLNDCVFKIIVTSDADPDTKSNNDDILFSDLTVIYTTALKIAPEHIYNRVEFANEHDKKVYVMVGEWNQVGRSADKINRKLEEARKAFEGSALQGIYAVNDETDDFFMSLEKAADTVVSYAKDRFETIRNGQTQYIYDYIVKVMNKDLREAGAAIRDDALMLAGFSDYLYKRCAGVKVSVRSAGNNLRDLRESLVTSTFMGIPRYYTDYAETDDIEAEVLAERVKERIKTGFLKALDEKTEIELDEETRNKFLTMQKDYVQDIRSVSTKLFGSSVLTDEEREELSRRIDSVEDLEEVTATAKELLGEKLNRISETVVSGIMNIKVDTSMAEGLQRGKDFVKNVMAKANEYATGYTDVEDDENVVYDQPAEPLEDETGKVGSGEKGGLSVIKQTIATNLSDPNVTKSLGQAVGNMVTEGLDARKKNALNLVVGAVIEKAEIIITDELDRAIKSVTGSFVNSLERVIDNYFNSLSEAVDNIQQELEKKKASVRSI